MRFQGPGNFPVPSLLKSGYWQLTTSLWLRLSSGPIWDLGEIGPWFKQHPRQTPIYSSHRLSNYFYTAEIHFLKRLCEKKRTYNLKEEEEKKESRTLDMIDQKTGHVTSFIFCMTFAGKVDFHGYYTQLKSWKNCLLTVKIY